MNKKTIFLGCMVSMVILLTGVILSAPVLPSTVSCESNCSVYKEDNSKCPDCFVQVIYTQDNEINPPNKKGGTSEDDLLMDSTYTGDEDFGLGNFVIPLDLRKGDNIYIRAWDSRNIENSSYFGESKILEIDGTGNRYSLEDIYLTKSKEKDAVSVSGILNSEENNQTPETEEINKKREIKGTAGEPDEPNYTINESGETEEYTETEDKEKKYKGLWIWILGGVLIVTLIFVMKKQKKINIKGVLNKKEGDNGKKV